MNNLHLLNITDDTAIFLMEEYNINLIKTYGCYAVESKDYSKAIIAIENYLENNKAFVKKLSY